MKKSIFFIDDDDSFIYILNRCAAKIDGISKTFSARNGKDALEQLETWKSNGTELPNIMFIDVNMPVMDGFEFLNKFKIIREEYEGYKAIIPVVMLTSSEHERDKQRAMETGIVKEYVIKPAGIDKIGQILLDAIQ